MAKTTTAHSTAVSAEVSQPDTALSGASDIVIARAVAEAVRSTPVVLDLSPGIFELAATYGPRERVTGVVVRRSSPHDITIEVHVVLRGSLQGGSLHDRPQRDEVPGDTSRRGVSHRKASASTARDGVLTSAADQIRRAVYRAAQGLTMAPPTGVDVLIDDIQAPM